MGLLDWLKKPNKKDIPAELEKLTPNPPKQSGQPVSQAEKIISFVKTPLFEVSETIKLQVEDYTG